MIVILARFAAFTPEIEAEVRRNLQERFLPALQRQPGFISGYWGTGDDGNPMGVTIWESQEAAETGARAANATPLLPGQDSEKLPSPERFELIFVTYHTQAPRHPTD